MKELTCIECHKKFQVRHLDLSSQSGFCPECELDNKIENAQKDIKKIHDDINFIRPELYQLKKQKEDFADAYYKAKSEWSTMANLYEKMDRKAAMIQHELQIMQGKKRSKKTKKVKKSAEEIALKALKDLSQEELLHLISSLT